MATLAQLQGVVTMFMKVLVLGIKMREELCFWTRGLVAEVRRVNDRVMIINLVIGGLSLNVISAYALRG